MKHKRVVVTGMGLVTPLGCSVPEVWERSLRGDCGIQQIPELIEAQLPVHIAGQVQGFNPDDYISPKEQKKMDLFIQYGLGATQHALADAQLDFATENPERIGVAIGSGIGGLSTIEQNHTFLTQGSPRKVSPFFIPKSIVNMIPGHVSIQYGLKGPNLSIVSACTTGTHNIGEAARIIDYGDADVMIAGGCEHAATPLGVAGFAAARALAADYNDEPQASSRPWDTKRCGFVMGSGAGIIVLESYEHAKQRGAKIYCELAGYGASGDAYHMTAPAADGDGAVRCMRQALQSAQMTPEEIGYVNAHATSTLLGDKIETLALKTVFGDHAYKLAVNATKSLVGHLIGAAGSVEAIISILTLNKQIAHPTINLDHPDPECDLNYVPHKAQEIQAQAALSNSFGFGGTNGSLIFKTLA